jgi:hypothetical protein
MGGVGRPAGVRCVEGRTASLTRTAWGTAWVRPPMAAPAGGSREPLGPSAPRLRDRRPRRLGGLLMSGELRVLVLTRGDGRASLGRGAATAGLVSAARLGAGDGDASKRSPPHPHNAAIRAAAETLIWA